MTFARLALTLSLCLTPALHAQDAKPEAKPDTKFPIANTLPADAHVAQTIELNGHPLKYTATVGSLPLKNAEGKPTGEVVFTSYIVDSPLNPGPAPSPSPSTAAPAPPASTSTSAPSAPNASPSVPKAKAPPTPPSSPTTPAPGSTSPTSSSSTPSAPASPSPSSPLRTSQKALLRPRPGHRLPLPHRLRLARQKRPPRAPASTSSASPTAATAPPASPTTSSRRSVSP